MPKDDSGNNCAVFTLDTIITTTNLSGYNLKTYTKTNSSDITIRKQDGTVVSTNPSNPTEIINTTTTSTNDKQTTIYQACAGSNMADGSYNTEIAYVIQENIPCVQGPQFKGDVGNMQSIDVSVWDQGDTGIAIDTRNDQEYCIGKLKDEKVWMLDNLKLELGVVNPADTTKDTTILEPANTNVDSNKTVDFAWSGFISGTNDGGNFVKTGYLTKNGTRGTDLGGNYYTNLNAWRQVDPKNPDMSNSTNCQNNTGTDNDNGNISYNTNSKTGCGYLYNFYTATASTAEHNKTYSICPSGWKLPSGQVSGDFSYLDSKYTPGTGEYHDSDVISQGLWLSAGAWQGAFSGYYDSDLHSQSLRGDYWSSSIGYSITEDSASETYILSTAVAPGMAYSVRYNGLAVRCLVS
ncbi:MAG: fibrobacter succinogenes major paralogous domain-containing protein [Candidatus Nomurabacteria bacterium]|nr:fibrobacter succinogenes major paralogous domain-containing protein [Candidatus Nomurabacteria bacterium]